VLAGLSKALKPTNGAHQPFASLVLFDALLQGPAAATDLKSVIRPIKTPEMDNAELAGRGMSTLFEGAPAGKAVIVDLPGDQSVAFAAGLANRFDPVFFFDNWPHPKGTVPAHRTLAAAIQLQPAFTEMARARPDTAPPVFVLDAHRIDEFKETQFDNRYVAGLPAADALKKMGINEVLLVRPKETDKELDDLNHQLADYKAAGIGVKPVPEGTKHEVAAAGTTTTATDDHYHTGHQHHHYHHYGGMGYHWAFWSLYAFGSPRYHYSTPSWSAPSYQAQPRATKYGRSARPNGFGAMAVDRSGSSGKPSLSRSQSKPSGTSSGSWGRTSGGSSS
jgi:hypothetical protein